MLKEKIFYSERLPVNVNVVNIEEYPIHFHDDMEILFVIEGSIILKNGYYNYKMQGGDIFILNDREIHSFSKVSDDNKVLMFQFDINYFLNHYPGLSNSFFVADMSNPDDEDLELLRELLASAIMQANSGNLGYEQKLIEITHNIISCLMENFQYFAIEGGRFVNEKKNKSNKILAARMDRVSHYLYENYARKLTLQEIAEREHLSIYHLSHVIKQSSGLSFKEFLGFIRVEESEKLLLGSDMSINAISEAVGFSATRYYIEHFKKWFGKDPSEYRNENERKVSSRKTPAVMKRINKFEIGEVIKRDYPDVYYDYHKKDQIPSQVMDIYMDTDQTEDITETPLYNALSDPGMEYASMLMKMLVSLDEPVVASGENYVVTCDKHANHISILVYNLEKKSKPVSDILVRLNEIAGEYNLKRVTASYDNNLPEIKDKKDKISAERKDLFRQLEMAPVVESSVVTAVNTLNFVLSFSGLCGELLLLDKIVK